jgi:diguanylate cyclase (GGDEF)-like protein/PAS domain S-box-containing protein
MIIFDKSKIDLEDELLNIVMNMVEDFIFILDKDYNILKANERSLNFYGHDITGRKCHEVVRAKSLPCSDCTINLTLQNREVQSREIFNDKNGQYFSMKTYPLVDEDENLLFVIETFRDITRIKRLETEVRRRDSTIRKMTITDELTGLWNHNYIYRRLREEMKKTSRYGHPFSFLIVDLDDFKAINERYGHSGGDLVLVSAARIISQTVRESDLAGRFGGEEFAILTAQSEDHGAERLAQRLIEKFRDDEVQIGDLKVRYTTSIGVATFHREDEMQLRQFIAHAEEAMYCAKSMGKNRSESFENIKTARSRPAGQAE